MLANSAATSTGTKSIYYFLALSERLGSRTDHSRRFALSLDNSDEALLNGDPEKSRWNFQRSVISVLEGGKLKCECGQGRVAHNAVVTMAGRPFVVKPPSTESPIACDWTWATKGGDAQFVKSIRLAAVRKA